MITSHLIRLTLLAFSLTAALSIVRTAQPSASQAVTTAGDVARGEQLFLAVGCYECHGTTGAGAYNGPKLAPYPVPLQAFIYQLRHPIGAPPYGNIKMPTYGVAVLSDAQVRDLYASLLS